MTGEADAVYHESVEGPYCGLARIGQHGRARGAEAVAELEALRAKMPAAARQALLGYAWPGNVRELEHVISRAALKLLCRVGSSAFMSLEPQWLGLGDAVAVLEPPVLSGEVFQPLAVAVDECQRHKIRQALEHCGGNWASAARLLGVDSSNLHKLARRLGLK